jgi:hypothetical protein
MGAQAGIEYDQNIPDEYVNQLGSARQPAVLQGLTIGSKHAVWCWGHRSAISVTSPAMVCLT